MKRIAITQRMVTNTSYPEIRDALDVQWGRFFFEMNWIPVIIPSMYPIELFLEQMSIDGIILTGGNDLYSVNQNDLSKKRDAYELFLIDYALNNKIPILGICRGMQLINEYFGGTLKEINGHTSTEHSITIEKENRFLKAYNRNSVNSFHNYTIDTMGNDLKIAGRSNDGAIEAFEHSTKPILSLMWHPEREQIFAEADKQSIKMLFDVK